MLRDIARVCDLASHPDRRTLNQGLDGRAADSNVPASTRFRIEMDECVDLFATIDIHPGKDPACITQRQSAVCSGGATSRRVTKQ
jgi:hypothetical protein